MLARAPVLALLALALLAGCGAAESVPIAVGPADLERDGGFWNELTPDLKFELVELARPQLAGERPSSAAFVEAERNQPVVAEIDRQFSNESKRGETIYRTYVDAIDQLALERVRELVPHLAFRERQDPVRTSLR